MVRRLSSIGATTAFAVFERTGQSRHRVHARFHDDGGTSEFAEVSIRGLSRRPRTADDLVGGDDLTGGGVSVPVSNVGIAVGARFEFDAVVEGDYPFIVVSAVAEDALNGYASVS